MKPVATTAANFNANETGYITAHIAMPYKTELYTADQLRQAKVEVLREAAARFTGRGSEHTSTAVELELRRMADEIERAGK